MKTMKKTVVLCLAFVLLILPLSSCMFSEAWRFSRLEDAEKLDFLIQKCNERFEEGSYTESKLLATVEGDMPEQSGFVGKLTYEASGTEKSAVWKYGTDEMRYHTESSAKLNLTQQTATRDRIIKTTKSTSEGFLNGMMYTSESEKTEANKIADSKDPVEFSRKHQVTASECQKYLEETKLTRSSLDVLFEEPREHMTYTVEADREAKTYLLTITVNEPSDELLEWFGSEAMDEIEVKALEVKLHFDEAFALTRADYRLEATVAFAGAEDLSMVVTVEDTMRPAQEGDFSLPEKIDEYEELDFLTLNLLRHRADQLQKREQGAFSAKTTATVSLFGQTVTHSNKNNVNYQDASDHYRLVIHSETTGEETVKETLAYNGGELRSYIDDYKVSSQKFSDEEAEEMVTSLLSITDFDPQLVKSVTHGKAGAKTEVTLHFNNGKIFDEMVSDSLGQLEHGSYSVLMRFLMDEETGEISEVVFRIAVQDAENEDVDILVLTMTLNGISDTPDLSWISTH